MNIKDLKKMLYNRKRMQKHVEKFTNGTNDVLNLKKKYPSLC